MTRKEFLKKTVKALAVSAGLSLAAAHIENRVAYAQSGGTERATPVTAEDEPTDAGTDETDITTETSTSDEVSDNTGNLDKSSQNPDPSLLLDQPREAIMDMSTVYMDKDKAPEDSVAEVVDRLKLIFIAGNTEEDKKRASLANLDLKTYAKQTYREPLHEGIFKHFASGAVLESDGMAKLIELEDYFSQRFEKDSRYTTLVEILGMTTEQSGDAIIANMQLSIKNTIPQELGEDPAPYEWLTSGDMVLQPMYESGSYAVNLESFEPELT